MKLLVLLYSLSVLELGLVHAQVENHACPPVQQAVDSANLALPEYVTASQDTVTLNALNSTERVVSDPAPAKYCCAGTWVEFASLTGAAAALTQRGSSVTAAQVAPLCTAQQAPAATDPDAYLDELAAFGPLTSPGECVTAGLCDTLGPTNGGLCCEARASLDAYFGDDDDDEDGPRPEDHIQVPFYALDLCASSEPGTVLYMPDIAPNAPAGTAPCASDTLGSYTFPLSMADVGAFESVEDLFVLTIYRKTNILAYSADVTVVDAEGVTSFSESLTVTEEDTVEGPSSDLRKLLRIGRGGRGGFRPSAPRPSSGGGGTGSRPGRGIGAGATTIGGAAGAAAVSRGGFRRPRFPGSGASSSSLTRGSMYSAVGKGFGPSAANRRGVSYWGSRVSSKSSGRMAYYGLPNNFQRSLFSSGIGGVRQRSWGFSGRSRFALYYLLWARRPRHRHYRHYCNQFDDDDDEEECRENYGECLPDEGGYANGFAAASGACEDSLGAPMSLTCDLDGDTFMDLALVSDVTFPLTVTVSNVMVTSVDEMSSCGNATELAGMADPPMYVSLMRASLVDFSDPNSAVGFTASTVAVVFTIATSMAMLV